MGAPQAEAAVTAVTFAFGPVFNAADGAGAFQTTPAFGALGGYAGGGYSILGFFQGAVYNRNQEGYAFGFPVGTPSFFASGTVIGNGNNGPLGWGVFSHSSYSDLNLTTNELDKNIGFVTSTGNWGWANVSWNATAKEVTINSAYIESVADTPITIAGAAVTPEPSRALLALAGLGAAGLRRRRKQAA
jgi:MYXO-CTERM domain-containing protein